MIGAIILAAGSSRRFGDDKRRARLPSGKLVIQQAIENARTVFDEALLVLRHGDNEFEAEIERLFFDPGLTIYRAPDSAKGMGHSLANAISQVSHWEGAFVFLADMPHIRKDTLNVILSKAKNPDNVILSKAKNPDNVLSEAEGSVISTEGGEATNTVISTGGGEAAAAEKSHADLSTPPSVPVEMTGSIIVPTFNGNYGHPVGFHNSYFQELSNLTGDKGAKPIIQAHPDKVIEVPVEDAGVVVDIDTPEDLAE